MRLQTASPELFLPCSSVFPYPTTGKRGAAVPHLQAGASSMQVSTLLLSCQPWLILQLFHQPVAGSGEALWLSLPGSPGLSLGTARGHVCLQTAFDSGCELLPCCRGQRAVWGIAWVPHRGCMDKARFYPSSKFLSPGVLLASVFPPQ